MIRCLNDDLMSSDGIHQVIHPLGPLIHLPFDTEKGEFVGHHAHSPFPFSSLLDGQDVLRRKGLISRTKGARLDGLEFSVGFFEGQEVLGTFSLPSQNNNPPTGNGLSSQFRHGYIAPG